MSFFRAWLYGFAIFIAATTSLTVALTIAITGPPTASEIEDLGAFLSNAGRELALGAEDLGAEACVQFPEAALCPQTTIASAPTPPVAEPEQAIIIEAPVRPSEAVEQIVEDPGVANDVGLLGSATGDAPVVRERVRAEPPRRERVRPAQRERRQVARAPAERRASPPRQRARADARRPAPPLAVARVEAVAPLADTSTSALEALLDASVPEVVAEEVSDEGGRPTQEQAAPVRGEEDSWDSEPAYVGEPAYEEEPAYQSDAYYEQIYAEREAERRDRAERRRAYREWRRRYEGW